MRINSQSSSSFFAIPSEIREAIYAYYPGLTFHHSDLELSRTPMFRLEPALSKPLPALILGCKRAYRKMRPAVHEEAVMTALPSASRGLGLLCMGT